MLALESALLTGALEPAKRAIAHSSNEQFPNILPGSDAILSAWIRGFILNPAANIALTKSGINVGQSLKIEDPEFAECWQGVTKLLASRPGASEIYAALNRGIINKDEATALAKRAAVDANDYNVVADSFRAQLSPLDLVTLQNRGLLEPGEFEWRIKRFGGYEDRAVELIGKLTQQIPGVQDIIRFSVREAFSPDVAGPLGYYQEYPAEVEKWAKAQGYGWDLGFGLPGAGQANWAKLWWAAHWQTISPTQSYQMLHKLRPDRIARYRDRGIEATAFTADDVARWLRVNDYPVSVRANLAAISYNPFRLVDINRAVKLRIFGDGERKWATDQYQDRGLHPDDATTAYDLAVASRREDEQRKAEAKEARDRKPIAAAQDRYGNRIVAAYRLGTLTADEARRELAGLKWDNERVDWRLRDADLQQVMTMDQSQITRIRTDFRAGAIDGPAAETALKAAGIGPERVAQYMATWSAEMSHARRAATAAKIQSWYRRHYIDRAEATRRLTSLGWGNYDILLILADADREAGDDEGKLQSVADRNKRTQMKEIERMIRDRESRQAKARKELERLAPPAKLLGWLKAGVITTDYFARRLAVLGYDRSRIDFDIAAALVDSAGKVKVKAKSTNGNGSGSALPLEESPPDPRLMAALATLEEMAGSEEPVPAATPAQIP